VRWFRAPELTPRTWRLIALAASAAVPVAVSLVLVPVRGHVPNATVALVLAVVVAILATVGTRCLSAVAAVSASIGFDVFHTRPYGSLTINRAQDIETTVLLLAVGLVVGQLAARNRQHRHLAAETSFDIGRIHAVAEMVASGAPVDQVILAVEYELNDLLGLRSSRFDPAFAERSGPFVERQGAITWGNLQWEYATSGLPAHEITLIVQHQGYPLGRYVLAPLPGKRVTEDQLVAAVALADQAGAAIAAQGIPSG
jgi:K+-sensing histidine kinase KdpD